MTDKKLCTFINDFQSSSPPDGSVSELTILKNALKRSIKYDDNCNPCNTFNEQDNQKEMLKSRLKNIGKGVDKYQEYDNIQENDLGNKVEKIVDNKFNKFNNKRLPRNYLYLLRPKFDDQKQL